MEKTLTQTEETIKTISKTTEKPVAKTTDKVIAKTAVKTTEKAPAKSTDKTEVKKISTSKTETKKIGTTKAETKKIGTTKAEPVTKRITTKKNSGNANVYVQYAGKEVNVSKLIKDIEDKTGAVKNLDIYIKPEDGKAYYVCDSETGSIFV